eukprot:GDKJ01021813.1.p1 GENE.GDKJ01021813.1~~GDKJ01021813.1.p1  ORF type:complete len:486 (+),score=101.35 GDKJ01021813.1:325-1782(+)
MNVSPIENFWDEENLKLKRHSLKNRFSQEKNSIKSSKVKFKFSNCIETARYNEINPFFKTDGDTVFGTFSVPIYGKISPPVVVGVSLTQFNLENGENFDLDQAAPKSSVHECNVDVLTKALISHQPTLKIFDSHFVRLRSSLASYFSDSIKEQRLSKSEIKYPELRYPFFKVSEESRSAISDHLISRKICTNTECSFHVNIPPGLQNSLRAALLIILSKFEKQSGRSFMDFRQFQKKRNSEISKQDDEQECDDPKPLPPPPLPLKVRTPSARVARLILKQTSQVNTSSQSTVASIENTKTNSASSNLKRRRMLNDEESLEKNCASESQSFARLPRTRRMLAQESFTISPSWQNAFWRQKLGAQIVEDLRDNRDRWEESENSPPSTNSSLLSEVYQVCQQFVLQKSFVSISPPSSITDVMDAAKIFHSNPVDFFDAINSNFLCLGTQTVVWCNNAWWESLSMSNFLLNELKVPFEILSLIEKHIQQ